MKITKKQLQVIIREELGQVMEQERTMAQQIARDDWLQAQAAADADTRFSSPTLVDSAREQLARGYEVQVAPEVLAGWQPGVDDLPIDATMRADATPGRIGMENPKDREWHARTLGHRGPAAQRDIMRRAPLMRRYTRDPAAGARWRARQDPYMNESLINDITESVLAKLTKR